MGQKCSIFDYYIILKGKAGKGRLALMQNSTCSIFNDINILCCVGSH